MSKNLPKPEIILKIEKVVGVNLFPSPIREDRLGGLMPTKKDQAKYLFDDNETLIGLNLAFSNVTDEKWRAVLEIISSYKADLRALNLFGNQLTEFRLQNGLQNLKRLFLDENPLEFPTIEVVKQGNEAILRFLRDVFRQGERDVFEVKMLIVGEGETGKTTLWKKLQNPDHPVPDPDQESTVGIGIKEGWSFDHPDLPGTKFLVNLWDFGGQEIQYMTHQFFLTRRSFYVLLADGRRESSNFSYWFEVIQLLGCEGEEKPKRENETNHPGLPLLVVLNEKGNPNAKYPYNPDYATKAFPKLDIIRRQLDLKENKDGRFQALITTIKDILCHQLDHLPLTIPTLWDDVRNDLFELSVNKNKNYIRFDEFIEICKKNDIEDELQIGDLSQLLHDLGVILHYRQDLNLEDFVVLKPQWAVNGVYDILRHKDISDNQGRFNEADLRKIWTKKNYKIEEQAYLMNLMLKDSFEVCFKAEEAGKPIFIAPQLLPGNTSFFWDAGNQALRYTYQYPFMPKGIIGRLIVRLNEFIQTKDGKKVVWEKGMLLKDENSEAFVIEAKDRNTGGEIIKIEITGERPEDKRFLLRKIRDELGKIHKKSFPNLKFEEKIPCCCLRCIVSDSPFFYNLSNLNKRKEKGILTVQCDLSFEDVKVESLMDGVFSKEIQRDFRPEGKTQKVDPPGVKIFLSYSEKDKTFLDQLKTHMHPLIKNQVVSLWYDRMILPGEAWDQKIKDELSSSEIILLLVSPDFLATDYVWEVEIEKAMKREESGELRVIPIFLRPSDWKGAPFAKNNGLPAKGKYITKAPDIDEAWLEVVAGIKTVIEDLKK